MLRRCPACSAVNRIPSSRLTEVAKCGRCKHALPPIDTPLEVTDPDTFEELARSGLPVLVDFWATWCGPCRAVAPEVERAARTLASRALVVKVDVDRAPALAARHGIQSVPTFLVIQHGKPRISRPGAMRHDELVRLVERRPAA